ncbi:MAG TPA: hypothetical protein VI934_03860 [Candidatus Nanoarchaeia archaeon]|nr:hypothetical protein [Candidatus Nanoarchaeia archaeon]
MGKRGSYEIKKDILRVLREKPATYAELERKIDTGYRTIKANCEEMQDYGYITVERVDKHPANGRPSFKVKLSETGRAFLSRKAKIP